MAKVVVGARLILGVVFVVFGLNGFLHFLPQPAVPAEAGAFFGALARSRYMLPLLFATQLVGGTLVLAGIFVPFALVLLAPVIVNILLFHLFLDPAGIGPGLLVALCELVLAWHHRRSFRGLFA
jgi:putative oxidoreductase